MYVRGPIGTILWCMAKGFDKLGRVGLFLPRCKLRFVQEYCQSTTLSSHGLRSDLELDKQSWQN